MYDEQLAQASYLLGCEVTREALVIDPNRDIASYLEAAADHNLRITGVAETHIHADFLSGSRELANLIGARLYLSAHGGDQWSYRFAAGAGTTLLRDGDAFQVGRLRVEAMATPGHTPEHLALLVTESDRADRPVGVFTGDFVFVGDVGRPDLLERAAGHQGTAEDGARQLFASLRRFAGAVPDFTQLWPGHGAGSACGKSLGSAPQTTLGYERRFNWAFAIHDEAEFVAAVLRGQPEPPMYFAVMKRLNRDGPPPLGALPHPVTLPAARIGEALAAGTAVIDARATAEFAAGHVAGALSVPLGGSFATWAGSVVPFDRPILLVATASAARQAARAMALIGLDHIVGFVEPSAALEWAAANGTLQRMRGIAPVELARMLSAGGAVTVDVRNAGEWEAGRVPGSINVPLGRLPERLHQLPRDRELVVHCQTGARAVVTVSALRAAGFRNVAHLEGDFAAWSASGQPVERPAS